MTKPKGVRCKATNRKGVRCAQWVVPGATVCRYHGAGAPQVVAAARRRILAAEAGAELHRLGVSIETTSDEVLEAMLWEAAGNVAVLRELVAGLGLHADVVRTVEDLDDDLVVICAGGGIAGQVKFDSAEAKPHVFVVMYNEERDRLAALAVACTKLGLDERRVRMAEADTTRLFGAVQRALTKTGLTGPQREAFTLALAGELRAVAA